MNALFFVSSLKGYFLFFIGAFTLLTLVYLANVYGFYMDRILSSYLILLLLISELGIFSVALIGKHLRTHKEEPLYLLSVFHSIAIILILSIILPSFQIEGSIKSMILLNFLILPPLAILIARNFLRRYYL